MKKVLAVIVCLALIIAVLPLQILNVSAATEYTSGYYTYTISNDKATITDVNTYISGAVTIPSSLGGYPVTSIGDYAFSYCRYLASVTIPNSVTNIGDHAFYNCTSLTSITIPDSVIRIGGSAFYNTAWYNNQPNGLVYVGKFAYGYKGACPETIIIKDGTLGIACYAFEACDSLKSITMPDSVIRIGDHAFIYCTSLTSITIGESVTSIGSYSFYNCDSLTSITIPDSVTSIGSYSFYDCDSLTSITIPDSVTSIGAYAFEYCDSLTSVTIGDGVTSIKYSEFSYCTSLTSITIGNNLTSIGIDTFYGCDSLKTVYFRGSRSDRANITIGLWKLNYATWYYNSCIGSAEHIYDNMCDTICNVCDLEREVPDHVYDNACDTDCNICGYIRTVNHNYEWVVDKVETCNKTGIKHEECTVCHTKLNESTIIPATGIHEYDNTCDTICNECDYVREITHTYDNTCDAKCNVCGNVRAIKHAYDNECDTNCNICEAEREVPDHVYDNNSDAECNICGYVRYYTYTVSNGNATITDVDASISGEIIIPSTLGGYPVTSIGERAFRECRSITSITIPEGVTSIGEYAFYKCEFLTSVTIPDSVTSIGSSAFHNCYKLTNITIPDNVTNIGSGAFYNCSKLTTVNIPNKLTTIEAATFYGCDSLTSVTIGNSVTSIGERAFRECSALTNVTIPDSVTSIGESAFQDCASLTSVNILDNVTSIERYAFYNCGSLTNLTIGKSVTSIVEYAFWNCPIKAIYYRGSETDKSKISMGLNNGNLTTYATWHYNSCIGSAVHTYDSTCDTACNVCGDTRTITHTYDNECDSICNICKFEREVPGHTYDNACDTKCNICETERNVPDHMYDNDCDPICNECKLEREVPDHVYDNDCDVNCNKCQLKREVPGHIYVKKGENTATCKNCNLSKTFDFIITTDETITLSYEASKEFDFAIEHTSIAKITNVSSSIVSMGSYYRQSSSAKVLSVFPGETVVKIVATNGTVLTTSSLLVVEGEHQLQFSEILEEATCTESGKELHICKFCGYEEEIISPSLGHTEVIDKAVAPTCTKTGLTEGKHCSVCNAVLVAQEVVPKTGEHIWNSGRVDDEGDVHYGCTTCDETWSKELLSIAITTLPDKLLYIAGEHYINFEGMVITAYYDDGSKADVTHDCTRMWSGPFGPPAVTVTVEYKSKSASFEATVIMLGDCNGDGNVNTTDLAVMKLFLAGVGELSDTGKLGADLNSDGDINTTDLASLKLKLAGI